MQRRTFLSLAAAPLAGAGAVNGVFESVPLGQVQAAGVIGERMELTWRGNILKLDVDRDFLAPFLDKKYSGKFIGLGMFTDAVVRFAFQTRDVELLNLKRRLVDGILRNQEADGYAGNIKPAERIRRAWDVHEMSYMVYSLTSDYLLFGEKRSLDAARRTADYLVRGLQGKGPAAIDTKTIHFSMVITGFDRTMLALHRATGDGAYLDILNDVQLADWDLDIVEGRKPPYYGHAYEYFCRSLAQLELYHRNGDKRLLRQTGKAMDFLRKRGGLLVTGSASKDECWHSDHSGTGPLTETCATAYLIRWLDQLLRLEGNSLYGDMMERAIYNALFAAQSPDGRRLRYWAPFEGKREYFKEDTYCCPNNYRRIVSDLPSFLYYRAGADIVVNLYSASTAQVGTVKLRQVTEYPKAGVVRIHVDPQSAAEWAMKLRIPRWCQSAKLTVNGKAVAVSGPGFAEVRRKWKRGDVVELNMDMPWRTVRGVRTQEGRVAMLRGPQLYCSKDPAERTALVPFPDPDGVATYFPAKAGEQAPLDELVESI